MIKNIVQPFVSSLINDITPAGEGAAYFGGGFASAMSTVTSSLIDSVTISSGSTNIYGQLYSGYGRGLYNAVYGSTSPSDFTMANGDTHPLWGVYQYNNRVFLMLGSTAPSNTYTSTTSVVPNTDTDAFKTLKIVDPASDAVLYEVDRDDFDFQNTSAGYTYYNGSMQNIYFPTWRQPSAAFGNFFGGHGSPHQNRRIELWS